MSLPWETSRREISAAVRSALKKQGLKNFRVRCGRPGATNSSEVTVSHWMYEPRGPNVTARTKAHSLIRELVEPILPDHRNLEIIIRGGR